MIRAFKELTERKVRVFVSSTFSDMHEERDLIVNTIFPKLRREYASRLIDIVEIDLRWGIPQKMVDNGLALEICIGEVLRCKPFFLGILGGRYGYVTNEAQYAKLPASYKKAIGKLTSSCVSITEMEMRAGVLSQTVPVRASFQLRGANGGDKEDKHLTDLRECIKKDARCHAENYDNLEDFERNTYEALKKHIDNLFPNVPVIPYGDAAYYTHLNLLKRYCSRYAPSLTFVQKVTRQLEDGNDVFIYGGKGTGKSAFMSYLIKQMGEDKNRNVFFHYVSAGGDSRAVDALFRRIYLNLTETFGITPVPADNIQTAVKELISGLKTEEPIYLFIDASEQLISKVSPAVLFGELSKLNPKLTVVLSGVTKPQGLCGAAYEMPLLTKPQIRRVSRELLSFYGKNLTAAELELIADNASCANPLFLTALLDELRVHGQYESFADYFKCLTGYSTFGELFSNAYDRLCAYFKERGLRSSDIAKAFGLLLYSYRGVSENEMMSIAKIPPLAWVSLYSTLENYVYEQNGILFIGHDLIRAEMQKLLDISSQKDGKDYVAISQRAIIRYFRREEASASRRAEELSFAYDRDKRYGALTSVVARAANFACLVDGARTALVGYFNHLQKKQGELQTALLAELKEYSTRGLSTALSGVLCQSGCFTACESAVNGFLADKDCSDADRVALTADLARCRYKLATNRYALAEKTYDELIALQQRLFPEDTYGLMRHTFMSAIVQNSMGHIDRAISLYEQVVDYYRKEGIEDYNSSWAMGNLANCYYTIGCQSKGDALFSDAIRIRLTLFGEISSEIAWTYCYYWPNLYAYGRYDEAFETAKTACEIHRRLFGDGGVELAWSLQNYANMLMVRGDYATAESYFKRSIELNNSPVAAAKRPHIYSLTSYNNLGCLYSLQGKSAVEQLRQTLAYKRSKQGRNHVYTANCALNLANCTEDFKEALACYDFAVKTYRDSIGGISSDLQFALVSKARKCIAAKRFQLAKAPLAEALSIAESGKLDKSVVDYLLYKTLRELNNEGYAKELKELAVFAKDRLYLTHNNESEMIIII